MPCSNSTAAAAATVAPSFIAALRALPPIPRVVHVAWKPTAFPPSSLFSELTVRRLASTNPRWSVRLYNDSAIERYLRASLPAAAYAAVAPRPIVEKVDLWRLVVMHREGGVYADADRWALQPLDGALGPEARLVLPTFRDGGPSQDFMASAPGSPLFAHAIRLNVRAARRRLEIDLRARPDDVRAGGRPRRPRRARRAGRPRPPRRRRAARGDRGGRPARS